MRYLPLLLFALLALVAGCGQPTYYVRPAYTPPYRPPVVIYHAPVYVPAYRPRVTHITVVHQHVTRVTVVHVHRSGQWGR